MEYIIVFKTKHEEMHRKVKDFIDEMLQEYGVHPKFDYNKYKNSMEVRIESPISGRRNLDDLKDEDGNVDLNKVYD